MSVILVTASCFCLHLITVAPPRLLPHGGFVDTAWEYGQSVYGPTTVEVADQLSAFPSVHVGWAAIVAWWMWRVSPWRWGWLGVTHLVVTSFVVVATANHYWLDGLAAMAILAVALGLQSAVPALARAVRGPTGEPVEDDPAEVPAVTPPGGPVGQGPAPSGRVVRGSGSAGTVCSAQRHARAESAAVLVNGGSAERRPLPDGRSPMRGVAGLVAAASGQAPAANGTERIRPRGPARRAGPPGAP